MQNFHALQKLCNSDAVSNARTDGYGSNKSPRKKYYFNALARTLLEYFINLGLPRTRRHACHSYNRIANYRSYRCIVLWKSYSDRSACHSRCLDHKSYFITVCTPLCRIFTVICATFGWLPRAKAALCVNNTKFLFYSLRAAYKVHAALANSSLAKRLHTFALVVQSTGGPGDSQKQ